MLDYATAYECDQADSTYVYYTRKENEWYVDQLFNMLMLTKLEQNEALTLDLQIAKKIEGLGFRIADIKESSFEEMKTNFTVFTVELLENIEDYSALLQREKEISRSLELYEKNVILELV